MLIEKRFQYGGTCAVYNSLPNISTSIANVIIQWYGRGGKEREFKGKKTKRVRGRERRGRGSQRITEEGGKMQTQKGDESLAPSPQHQPMALNTGVHASVLT